MSQESNWASLQTYMEGQQIKFNNQSQLNQEIWDQIKADHEKLQQFLSEKEKMWTEYNRNNPSPPSRNSSNNNSSGSTRRRRPAREQEQEEQEHRMVTAKCFCGNELEFQLRQDGDRYGCPRCESTFKSVSNLEKHIKTGTKSCGCKCPDTNNNDD